MIEKLSYCISKYIKNNNEALDQNDFLKLIYVIQVIFTDTIILLLLFIFFGMLGKLFIFSLALIILVTLRPFMGGIHFNSLVSCTLVTIIHFSLIVFFSDIFPRYNNYIYVVIFLFSIILVLIYAPLPNKKRRIKNLIKLKIISLISLSFWISIFFYIKSLYICNTIFLSIILQSIQIIIINIEECFYE
ncbi:MAG: accessory gene regulator B family protein [Clostridium butyricum]